MTARYNKFIGVDATSFLDCGNVIYTDARHFKVRIMDNSRMRPQKIRVKQPNNEVKVPVHVSRWYSCRSRAKRKGIEFGLTPKDIEAVINLPCEYCNSSNTLSEIDRKDSSLGYVLSNIAPACRRCNTIKNNVVSYEEMMKIVDILGWNHA